MFEPPLELVAEHGSDGDPGYVPGWGALFDVNLCPTVDLPYLGQLVGVQIPAGSSDATARALIRAESGMQRGTIQSIQAAVERSISTSWMPNTAYTVGQVVQYGAPPVVYEVASAFTSGASFDATNLTPTDITQHYSLIERFDGATRNLAYDLTIIVDPEELSPAGNTTALLAAVAANKPAGITLHVVQTDTPLVSQYTRLLSAITVTLDVAQLSDVT